VFSEYLGALELRDGLPLGFAAKGLAVLVE
jgi:hypothetical protein